MDNSSNDDYKEEKPMKKVVGFSAEPTEELLDHHKQVRLAKEAKKKSNPFHKYPPELAHLEKKGPGPKPLPNFDSKKDNVMIGKSGNSPVLGDLRYQAVKEISIQNKDTEVNFHYPTIKMPVGTNEVLVDVKYGALNSFDMSKITSYAMNVSDVQIGLGYEFAGIILSVGKALSKEGKYAVNDAVVGIVNPADKKGSLSTSLVIAPGKDVLIKVEQADLDKLADIDTVLSFEKPDENENFEVESQSSETRDDVTSVNTPPTPIPKPAQQWEEELTPLAKLSTFPLLYCRAKQVLSHSEAIFNTNGKANILINGADTNLGFTLIQLLNSSLYKHLKQLNLILVVREKSLGMMENFLRSFEVGPRVDPDRDINFKLLSFDLINEDIVLPGERTPTNYKKPDLFASEILNALLDTANLETVDLSNIRNYRLDSFIDIVGCKKYFQTSSIRFKRLDSLQLPVHTKITPGTSLSDLFHANVKDPFLIKILKPKSWGSCLVSCCGFYVSNPTYNINDAISNATAINPYNFKWSGSLLNGSFFTKYNYYDDTKLTIKDKWVREGYNLLLDGAIKFRIDSCFDWRNNFKKHISRLNKDDRKVILKVESF